MIVICIDNKEFVNYKFTIGKFYENLDHENTNYITENYKSNKEITEFLIKNAYYNIILHNFK